MRFAAQTQQGLTLRLVVIAAATAVVMACGSAPAAQSSPTPSAATTPSPTQPLFAIVELASPSSQPSTVAIVGLDGVARATATFQPRVGPAVPDAYIPLQDVAQVVGTGVYYIDGAGTVRVLRVGSQPQVVARFPIQASQEDVWFAVSPDGSRVIAGILTLPALGPNVPGTGWPTLVGPWKFDLETAANGGSPQTLVHFETPYEPGDPNHGLAPTFPVGWTSAGPIAMLPTNVSSQNAWFGGPLYVLDAAGSKIQQIGGADCSGASITTAGLIPCMISSSNNVTVRSATGSVIWATRVDNFSALSLHISPDGQGISDIHQVERRDSGMVPMPTGFRVEGWLNNNTVFGRVTSDPNTVGGPNEGNLLWISLGSPATIHDLGFKGDFVATLG
jgi:hypothetical protein